MKKLGIALITLLALSAAAIVTTNLATDYGSSTVVNHSVGVVTMDFSKLLKAKNICVNDGGTSCVNNYGKTIKYYTTVAAYPTAFNVPDRSAYDGGSQSYNLVEHAYRTSGQVSGGSLFCNFDQNSTNSTYTVLKLTDGGYGITTTADPANLEWTAFCFVQAGTVPANP